MASSSSSNTKYEGDYLDGRFHGTGKYSIDEKTFYEGSFSDGMFHGEGRLYVAGGYYEGFWRNGKLAEGGFIFDDGLHYKKIGATAWNYCSPSDPRFYTEIRDGVAKGEQLRDITPHDFAQELPAGCFDVIDGYFDPRKHAIFAYDTNETLRVPTGDEIAWIQKNCRVNKAQ